MKFKLRENSIKLNMLISGLCKPTSMVISYIYVPIVLAYLGVEKYGVWATMLTILSWIGYFDIGIGNGLRNKLVEAIKNEDHLQIKKLVSSAYFFISIISLIFFATFCIIAIFLDWNKILGIENIDESLKTIIYLSVMIVTLNFVFSICRSILYAMQKASIVSILELATQVLCLVIVLIIRTFTQGSLLLVALTYSLSMLAINVGCNLVIFFKNRDYCPSVRCIDVKEGKKLTVLGIKFFVVQMCALVLFSTDSLIISYKYGSSNVTPYSSVNKLFAAISGVYLAFITPIWSEVTRLQKNGQNKKINKLIIRLLLFIIPFLLLIVFVAIFFRKISFIWLKTELEYTDLLILFGAFYCFLTIWCNSFASVANGLELMRLSIITAVVQAVINIPLSLVLAINCGLGPSGVLLGTVIAMAIAAIALPIGVFVYLGKNKTSIEDLERGEEREQQCE